MSDADPKARAREVADALAQENEHMIDGLRFVLTCGGCPEQYDVYSGFHKVGYVRLRHGYFYASVPDVGGETVIENDNEAVGDGIFDTDELRGIWLAKAAKAIRANITKDTAT